MTLKPTAEKSDLEKPRRSLLIISCVLIFIQIAGLEIKGLSVPGLTVQIQRPDLIVPFLWLIYIYSYWRFWVLSKPQHESIQERSNKVLSQAPYVASAIAAEGGINAASLKVVRTLFRREVQFLTQNELGEYANSQTVKLSYSRMLAPELTADIKSLMLDKASVEHTFPLIVAWLPICLFGLNTVQKVIQ